MVRQLVLTIAAGVILCSLTHANPIPDTVIIEMNDLARRWPDGLTQSERSRLVDHMGRYHFRFWDPEVREIIERRLDEYLPVLLDCQEPGHAIDFGLHRWFRAVASDQQRASMCEVLRRWLTEEMTEAPPDGAMRTTGPESAVKRQIMYGRVKAAEVLSDYGDITAARLIEELITVSSTRPDSADPSRQARPSSFKWWLEQALARLRDPDGAYILRANEDSTLQLASDLGPVVSASYGVPFSVAYEPMPVDPAVAQQLFLLLGESRLAPQRVRSRPGTALDVQFADGRRVQVYLGHRGHQLEYQDNMRSGHSKLSLLNPELFRALRSIHFSEEYTAWTITHSKRRRMPN